MNRQEIALLVNEINSFTPCITEDHLIRLYDGIEAIIMVAEHRYVKQQQAKILEATKFFAEAHKGVRRADEITPYLIHPLEVVCILFHFGIFNYKVVTAALCHDFVVGTVK